MWGHYSITYTIVEGTIFNISKRTTNAVGRLRQWFIGPSLFNGLFVGDMDGHGINPFLIRLLLAFSGISWSGAKTLTNKKPDTPS